MINIKKLVFLLSIAGIFYSIETVSMKTILEPDDNINMEDNSQKFNELSSKKLIYYISTYCKNKPVDGGIIDILIKVGADPNYCNGSTTPLLEALHTGKEVEVIQKLIDVGADIYPRNNRRLLYNGIPLKAAIFSSNSKIDNKIKIIDYLIKVGADINHKDCNGDSLLIKLLEINIPKIENIDVIFDKLIKLGIDIHYTNSTKNALNNAFFLALKYYPNFVPILIDKGIDINQINRQGDNAFLFLLTNKTDYEKLEIFKLLIRSKININYINPVDNISVLELALRKDYEVADLLIESGVNYKNYRGSEEAVKCLVKIIGKYKNSLSSRFPKDIANIILGYCPVLPDIHSFRVINY